MLTFLKVMNFPVVYSSPPPPPPKKSRTWNKPRRPINKATTNIHPVRHLNIILKVGSERGTIFVFFKHFWPKWPALWAKRPLQACMPGLSLRERPVSRPFPHGDGLLLVTPVSDLWPEYARSGTRLRTSVLLRS